MSGHTPGPWTVGDSEKLHIWSEDYGHVASVCEPIPGGNLYKNDLEIAEANARLIAAAPDLLEAAKYYLDPESTTAECDKRFSEILKAERGKVPA